MAKFDYKSTYAWQAAIELIPKVNRLSDDLPSSDQASMGGQLRSTVIDLASAVALDLIGESKPRFDFAIRLETQLEVIRQVYPALDTVVVDQDLAQLIGRMQGDQFAATKPVPAPASTSSADFELSSDSISATEPDEPDESSDADSQPVSERSVSTQISVNADPPS